MHHDGKGQGLSMMSSYIARYVADHRDGCRLTPQWVGDVRPLHARGYELELDPTDSTSSLDERSSIDVPSSRSDFPHPMATTRTVVRTFSSFMASLDEADGHIGRTFSALTHYERRNDFGSMPNRFIQRCTCVRALPKSRATSATLPPWRVRDAMSRS
jgi:hypothetical protein